MLDCRLGHHARHIGRNGKAQALRAASRRIDGGTDSNELAVHRNLRATRIAGIRRRIRLDEEAEVRDPHTRAGQGRDDAARHSLSESKRIADHQNPIAYPQQIGIAEFEIGQNLAARLDLEDGNIGTLVGQQDLGIEYPAVRKRRDNPLRRLDNMVIGDDDAVRPHNDTGTERIFDALATIAE